MSLIRFFFLMALIFSFSLHSSFSQNSKSFSKNTSFFPEEIKSIFKEDKNADKDQKASAEALMVNFEQLWNSGSFDVQQKTALLSTGNTMLKVKTATVIY